MRFWALGAVFEDAVDGKVSFPVSGGVLAARNVDEGDSIELIEFV